MDVQQLGSKNIRIYVWMSDDYPANGLLVTFPLVWLAANKDWQAINQGNLLTKSIGRTVLKGESVTN